MLGADRSSMGRRAGDLSVAGTVFGDFSGRDSLLSAHSLRPGRLPAHPPESLAVPGHDPLPAEHYAFLIRPRRFGKSLLENYYDRLWADEFDATFAGTDIGRDPTGEQSRYVTLRFNFSMVNDKLETLEREFETYCMIEFRGTLRRHPDLFAAIARQTGIRDYIAGEKVIQGFWRPT